MCIITQMYCLCATMVPVMCDTDRSFCHSVITKECVRSDAKHLECWNMLNLLCY